MRGSRPRIYLAGPITGCTYKGATDWRKTVMEELLPELIGVSPMRGKEYLAKWPVIGGTSKEAYSRENVISTPKGVISRDRWDVRTCDATLLNLLGAKTVSIGSMIEVGWTDAARNPLIVVRESDNVHSHMMLDEAASYTVPTLEEGVLLIRMLFHKER